MADRFTAMPERDTALVGVTAMMLYLYNTSPTRIVRDLFADTAPVDDYIREKVQAFLNNGYGYFWGTLDGRHQAKLVDLAMLRYGEEAAERVKIEKEGINHG